MLSGSRLEPNSVYAGIPAKKVKEITYEQRDEIVLRITAVITNCMLRGLRRNKSFSICRKRLALGLQVHSVIKTGNN